MFSTVKGLFGVVEVTAGQTHIVINGINANDFADDVKKIWKTSKVPSNIFLVSGRGFRSVSFPKFFAIEVAYILGRLLDEPRNKTPRRILHKINEELLKNTPVFQSINRKHPSRIDKSKLNSLNVTMLPHQDEFIEIYDANTQRYQLNGYLLAAAPGSGKTLNCIGLSESLSADVFIAISPLNALERVWEATMVGNIKANVDSPENVWVSKNLGEQAPDDKRYYAFHYDALDRAVILAKKLASKGKRVVIALDECHNINNPKSKRSELFEELCKMTKSKDVIWSSGTPIKAIGVECIVMLRTIAPDFTPIAEEAFRKIFGKDAGKANDILAHRLGHITFRVDKGSIVKGEVVINEIKVSIPNGNDYTLDKIRDDMAKFIIERNKYYSEKMPEIKTFYQECLDIFYKTLRSDAQLKEFANYQRVVKMMSAGYDARTMVQEAMFANKYELDQILPTLPKEKKEGFKTIRSAIKYLKLKIMGEALGGVLGKARSNCHIDMLEHIDLEGLINNAKKKTIIFTSYVEVVKAADEILRSKGMRPMMIYGATNKNLNAMIKEFAEDPTINPVIATYQSLSTAVPMIMANNIININQPFREHEREQSISRCNRLGQDETVYVNDTMLDTGSKGNVSTRSKDILEWSKAQVESIMGITTPANLEVTLESFAERVDFSVESANKFLNEMSALSDRLVTH